MSKHKNETELTNEEDQEEAIFTNKFSLLSLDKDVKENDKKDSTEGETEDTSVAASSGSRRKRGKKGKGTKGKRGKKSKGKENHANKESHLDELPLESYRIIEDDTDLVTDYLVAVYSLVKQWDELRGYLQALWREVAYEGKNSAVAGITSQIATTMVQQTQSTIFIDFPGNDSFGTVLKTITRGDPDKAQGMFYGSAQQLDPQSSADEASHTVIDIKEQFLTHAYYDLLDFITDFQHTRSGKPTKRMTKELNNWDPTFDLQQATQEQRIKWRRAYMINWLYDLVNVFSSTVVQDIKVKGEKINLETVDWSTVDPICEYRRLYGLKEFASDITSFAMQKPGTHIRQKILPHHVFQLQCIVDSFTVSRGWSINSLKGHVIVAPPNSFCPRKHIDLFMGRRNGTLNNGFHDGVNMLMEYLRNDALLHNDPHRHIRIAVSLVGIREHFRRWLGLFEYKDGLEAIPPSRFSNTYSNGLWEYSPFLCGTGLAEALELAFVVGIHIWDCLPETVCLMHIYNMLREKGYLTEEVGLFNAIQEIFKFEFFRDGILPTSDYPQAWLSIIYEGRSRRARFQRDTLERHIFRTTTELKGFFNPKLNCFFKRNCMLGLYRDAHWDAERIPDEDIPLMSNLAALRVHQTKKVTNPATGKTRMENTVLVNRARALGAEEEMMVNLPNEIQALHEHTTASVRTIAAALPWGYKASEMLKHNKERNPSSRGSFEDCEYVELLRWDLYDEICGTFQPLSSINYAKAAAAFMELFNRIERAAATPESRVGQGT